MEIHSGRIFVLGFMGSGKSMMAEALAKNLSQPFIDLDHWIESKKQLPISNIFEKIGQAGFRNLETMALREIFEVDRAIVAVGGGTPCHNENMAAMNSHGNTLYLKVSTEELYRRLSRSKGVRPLIAGMHGEALRSYIKGLLKEREPYYAQAKHILTSDNPGLEEALAILRLI